MKKLLCSLVLVLVIASQALAEVITKVGDKISIANTVDVVEDLRSLKEKRKFLNDRLAENNAQNIKITEAINRLTSLITEAKSLGLKETPESLAIE